MPSAARPADLSAKPGRAARAFTRGVLLAATFVMMSLAFPPFYLWPLGLLCLTPLALCVLGRPMNWKWLLGYYVLGATFFLVNNWWMAAVTGGGEAALSLFCGLYFALFAFCLHRLNTHLRWPAMLAVPLAWTATEYVRSMLFSGYAWFMLGTSLVPQLELVQFADLLGVSGVTFFLGMCSGYVVDLLRLPRRVGGRINPALLRLSAILLAVVVAVVAYGLFRLHQQTTYPGPKVAVVQDVIPQELKDSADALSGLDVFVRHARLSAEAAKQKPDLIVWPETMISAPMNPEMVNFDLENASDYWKRRRGYFLQGREYQRMLTNLSRNTGAALLVGNGALVPGENYSRSLKQNRAVLFTPENGPSPVYYAKRHLVPFGEYVPLKDTFPAINKFLLSLTPYGQEFDYSNTPGSAWTRFPLTAGGVEYHFGVPICFEDTMPYPSFNLVAPVDGKKSADFLLSISNDGWFHFPKLGHWFQAEHWQHLQMAQLRAIENRVPIARSVNTGNSGFIDSNGRVGPLVTDGGRSIGVSGVAVQTLPLDRRVSLYSRLGDGFPILCGIVLALATGYTIVRPRRR